MKTIGCLALIGVLAVVLVGAIVVGNQLANPGTSERSVDMVFGDYRFSPNQLSAKVGVPLTVRMTNRGSERHDLHFVSYHMPGLEGVESILEPGETRTVTVRFDQPGTHTFQCTLPGHAALGMTGAVFVSR